MNTPHKHSAVIHAYADGKMIQYRCSIEHQPHLWQDFNEDCDQRLGPWNDRKNEEWRIKPELRTGWVNIYDGWTATEHDTREEADIYAKNSLGGNKRIACVKYTEGEGL